MERPKPQSHNAPAVAAIRRKAVRLSPQAWIKKSLLHPDKSYPLVAQPATDGVDLVSWARDNRESIEADLLSRGAMLFRGFNVDSPSKFESFAQSLSSELMGYNDQHTPRTHVAGNVYTSTEYPADHHVPFHSENSKNHVWPMRLWFFCLQPAEGGGETPVADNRKVFDALDPGIRERFIEKKVMYVRNFGEGVGLPWQTAFQTDDRSIVEQYCHDAHMEYQWKDGNRLRVRHVCQSVARHPETGEMVWFNQAHLFHVSSLEPTARESLLSLFKEEDLPSNAYYGDGSPIETSALDEIREVFRRVAVSFPWQEKDIMMLDNMLVAHGRKPFTGTRKVLVAMADPHHAEPLE